MSPALERLDGALAALFTADAALVDASRRRDQSLRVCYLVRGTEIAADARLAAELAQDRVSACRTTVDVAEAAVRAAALALDEVSK